MKKRKKKCTIYILFFGCLGLGKLEQLFGIPLKFAVFQVGRAKLLDIGLVDLSALVLCGLLDPGRGTGGYGHELSLALEVMQLLGAFLSQDDSRDAAVGDLEGRVPGLGPAVGTDLFAFLIDQTEILLFSVCRNLGLL